MKRISTAIHLLCGSLLLSASAIAENQPNEKVEYQDYSSSFSPDGSKIAFTSEQTGNRDIFVIDVDATEEIQITFEDSDDWQPTWSPDGAKIAFCSNRSGNDDIYVMDADGTNPVNLTNHPADECEAGWSPSGEKIVFISTRAGDWKNNPEDNWEIYVMDADGSNQTRLTHTPGYDLTTGQAWSPDGAKIVFCSNMDKKYLSGVPNQFDGFDLYIMDADGSNIRQLTFTEGQDSYPYWSPDGRKISYAHADKNASIESHGGENYEIYVINTDGTGITRLTNDPGFDFEGWWSPDSKRIVYTSGQPNQLGIYLMNADGADKRRLTNKQNLRNSIRI